MGRGDGAIQHVGVVVNAKMTQFDRDFLKTPLQRARDLRIFFGLVGAFFARDRNLKTSLFSMVCVKTGRRAPPLRFRDPRAVTPLF
jgi:hypothetical protein